MSDFGVKMLARFPGLGVGHGFTVLLLRAKQWSDPDFHMYSGARSLLFHVLVSSAMRNFWVVTSGIEVLFSLDVA